jgi:hypothetical protein
MDVKSKDDAYAFAPKSNRQLVPVGRGQQMRVVKLDRKPNTHTLSQIYIPAEIGGGGIKANDTARTIAIKLRALLLIIKRGRIPLRSHPVRKII